jgi:DNA-binding response OmpR family regulator
MPVKTGTWASLLLVEDHPDNQELDRIPLDMQMAVMDGIEITQNIRQLE